MQSMTGFASATGALGAHSWVWDLRSVNGKGLDLRIRVPDWIDGLEAALKAKLSKALTRGNVTLSLRMQRDEAQGAVALNQPHLTRVLEAMAEIEQQAIDAGLSLAPSTAADIVGQRGILEQSAEDDDVAAVLKHLMSEFDPLLDAFVTSRATEGASVKTVLEAQLSQIETITIACAELAERRKDTLAENLKANVDRMLAASDSMDQDRLAQELALLAVKMDVTEEIDRLHAHVSAARGLLSSKDAVGRRMDFLMQEFNREANTLCSKAQSKDLTAKGLDLKVLIDQMREQVQNIE